MKLIQPINRFDAEQYIIEEGIYCDHKDVVELEQQRDEMLQKLIRFTRLVEEYQLDDDNELLIEMVLYLEKATNKSWEEIRNLYECK